MRAVAATLLVAAVAFAGDEGVELVCEFGVGEAAAAAKVLTKRFELLGIEGVKVEALEGGRKVACRLRGKEHIDEVRRIATKVGRVEFRRVVEPQEPGYEKHREQLDATLARGGEIAKTYDVPPGSLEPKERERWPGGLRWYRNPGAPNNLKEDWVLCEADMEGVTDAALDRVSFGPAGSGAPGQWTVHFEVKADSQDAMARLTNVGEPWNTRLAVIVDSEVVLAPVLRAEVRRSAEVNMPSEVESRMLAAAMTGALPSKPRVEERAVTR